MFRGFAVPAAALAATALAAATALIGSVPATAAGAPSAGDVCFWTAAGQHGSSWCYTPPGYTDVPEFLHDKAASFRSHADTAVYAIDWGRDTCYYRLIRAHDLADNWPWGARLDGVADTTMGCRTSS
ncbi:hypothetical protein GCM10011579_019220 [Streptomyces albiflavescens]|uniref:Peptidase inhibitor family I36 protein n=1 Tax=Streptomyces albiflavescens TaxID=1623582 RepID=A0A917XWP6_9ACTN|nr:hypothetical protein [Streptomyces albiflavescens]GGN57206.1 hypothetical protein GCM10011579_019220 [Streptomyces albiflavescens]